MPQVIVQPADEPISLADVKAWLRVDAGMTSQDAMFDMLIASARQFAEQEARVSLLTQTLLSVFNTFPGYAFGVSLPQTTFQIPRHALVLERGPVQSITSIAYTAMDGTNQVMSSSDYVMATVGGTSYVTPKFGKIWPIPLPQIGAVRVTYVAGYPSAESVPQKLKLWMVAQVATWYQIRAVDVIAQRSTLISVPSFERLLDDECAFVF